MGKERGSRKTASDESKQEVQRAEWMERAFILRQGDLSPEGLERVEL